MKSFIVRPTYPTPEAACAAARTPGYVRYVWANPDGTYGFGDRCPAESVQLFAVYPDGTVRPSVR